MSVQQEQSAHRPAASENGSFAATLLRHALGSLEQGELVVETPAGDLWRFEGKIPGAQARLTIHRWRCLWRLFAASDVGFAESYRDGDWSSPNLAGLLRFACLNSVAFEATLLQRFLGIGSKVQHALNRNTRRGSRRNISAHYDLGNEFYRHWLDSGMSYSSGLFSSSAKTLEQAQDVKISRVLEMLDVHPGDRVLEIGCGWGSLAARILQSCDCRLTGLTLSVEQLDWVRRSLGDRGLLERSEFLLQDYRDVRGDFDRIVSIEMLEAVGEAYWPRFFATLRDRLQPGGTAVLQVITIDESRFGAYRRRPDFIQKCIFPGGMLPTIPIVKSEAANAGLRFVSQEMFGESYARTLAEWQKRFLNAWPQIAGLGYDQKFKRTWEYYLSYCQAGFECGLLNVGLYKFVR